MPQKDNTENLVFANGECDNGASIVWDNEVWGPMVKKLSKTKTKCTIYFGKPVELVKDILPVESGDGLYKVEHTNLNSEWNKTEYRYAGIDPDNYVEFNNEIWRIIGLVNVKVGDNVEQRVKIVRTDGVSNQKAIGNYYWYTTNNNWTTSKLKDMLNGIYYESGTGDCYKSSSASECNFNLEIELPKGLDETARNMIDKEVIWKIGGSKTTDEEVTVKMFYERERGISTYNNYPVEWSDTTDVGDRYNGIALIYPSDYGYATNGGSIGREKCFAEYLYNWDSEDGNYQSECGGTDWLKPNSGCLWTLSPYSLYSSSIFNVSSSGYVNGNANNNAYRVWPTLYLTTSTKIVGGTGDINSPFVLSIQ